VNDLQHRETVNRLAAAQDRLERALRELGEHPTLADVSEAALLVSMARETLAHQERLPLAVDRAA
jgi:hypothetical protein